MPMKRGVRMRVVRSPARKSRFSRAMDWLLILAGVVGTFVFSGVIALLLATGTADPPVPRLIGLDPGAAGRLLAGAGLRITEAGNAFHDQVPAGHIARQEPAPGVAFKRGRSVRVYLSLGPTRSMVPRLEGEGLIEARRRLEADGFRIGRIAEVPNDFYIAGRVIAQSPVAYAEAIPGTEVSVLLSEGSESESFLMPDFIGRHYGDLADALSRASVRVGEVRNVRYPGVARGTVVDQSPRAGTRVTRANRIVLTLSR